MTFRDAMTSWQSSKEISERENLAVEVVILYG